MPELWRIVNCFNLVIENLLISSLSPFTPCPPVADMFQSRNRESFDFKYFGYVSGGEYNEEFQSRNRESFDFKVRT